MISICFRALSALIFASCSWALSELYSSLRDDEFAFSAWFLYIPCWALACASSEISRWRSFSISRLSILARRSPSLTTDP